MLEKNIFLFRSEISFADVAIFPFIRQFANVDMEFIQRRYIKIYEWLQTILENRLYLTVMMKYNEYVVGQNAIITDFDKKDV